MKFIVLLVAFSSLHIFAGDARDVYYQGNLSPRNIVPTWDHGYLAAYERLDAVSVYGPDGAPMYSAIAQVPGAKSVTFENAAVDGDGTAVGAIRYSAAGEFRGGIAIFDRSGTQTHFFDTSPYLPSHISVGPDHSLWTLWTLGWVEPRSGESPEDYPLLRNYSFDGVQIGAFVPRSSFQSASSPVTVHQGAGDIRIANGRVGAVFYAQSPAIWWIETDLEGTVLGRWELSNNQVMAFASNGAVYGRGSGGVSVLDRAARGWRRISGLPAGTLLGADGDDLVFLDSPNRIRRVSLPR